MAVSPRFLEDLRNKISLSEVIGRRVKLTRKGGEYTGLCPFHNEKTPSFTVSEDKGFYHCFGCGAHGDAIGFLMNAEKMPFKEALETLAHMAGLEIPQDSPAEIARFQRQTSMTAIMEKACAFYEEQLFKPAGREALSYLQSRGLSLPEIKTFRLGYAPTGNLLRSHLLRQGCDEKDLIELGLVHKSSDRAKDNYDYFRERVLFTITDRRGHVIGFGGRVMGAGEPKYLNSPETPLFHKGENLYALYQSMDAIRQSEQVVLVEGYMDVIALHRAGIRNVVAPLGTALTGTQLAILWKMAPEPLICFDGDGAGLRAADRAADRAIPILAPGKSLQFVFLPDKQDPDDFVKTHGPQEFLNLLKGAKSLTWLIWNRLTNKQKFDTPEKMALLEKETKELVSQIKDASVRSYYEKELKARLKAFTQEILYPRKNSKASHKTASAPLPGLSSNLSEIKMLLAYAIFHPHQTMPFLEAISALPISDPKALRLMDILGTELTGDHVPDYVQLRNTLEIKYSKNIFVYLQSELEILERAQKSPEEAKADMERRMNALHLGAINEDIQRLIHEFTQNPSPELWTQVLSLREEKEKLTQKI